MSAPWSRAAALGYPPRDFPAAKFSHVSSSALARAVFGLLVVATVGAFFVTQRLKRSPPPVKRIAVPHYIAPDGGPKRLARMHFALPKGDYVTASMVTGGGDEVKRLIDDRQLGRGTHYVIWNGRDASNRIPPDGVYYLQIVLHGQGREVTSPRGVDLVTRPPVPRLVSVRPSHLTPERTASVTATFDGPTNPPARFTVYRTDGDAVRAVASFRAARGARSATWDVRIGSRPAPAGLYTFAVTVENRALIPGSAPARLPPTRIDARRGTGLTISGPSAVGPLEPITPGGDVQVELAGARGPVGWSVTRVGARRAISSGTGSAPALAFTLDRRATTGLYEIVVHAPSGTARVPLAVRTPAHSTPKVLVVLPTINWQADNPTDEDDDGFADTLADTPSVSLARPFAFGRPPPDFESEAAPLLRFLDTQHLGYDVTTDLALARGHGPSLSGYRAVALAGSERWTTPSVAAELRAYVEGGGRLASFGTDALRRSAALAGDTLRARDGESPYDAFGERSSPLSTELAPLVVSSDSLGLFAQTSGAVGLFSSFEQSDGLPAGARVLTAAGRDPAHPAFVAYALGRGLVVRTGTAQWSAALASDAQVQDVTTGLWSLLSR